mmetsp:Transcript_13191/g.22435  ORF Transcript_13191/g.22435 Transcript_13191/m.22435 type:complete len:102 (-) Transcript_13191:898-1203(-)
MANLSRTHMLPDTALVPHCWQNISKFDESYECWPTKNTYAARARTKKYPLRLDIYHHFQRTFPPSTKARWRAYPKVGVVVSTAKDSGQPRTSWMKGPVKAL